MKCRERGEMVNNGSVLILCVWFVQVDEKINDAYFKKSAKADKAFLQGEEVSLCYEWRWKGDV